MNTLLTIKPEFLEMVSSGTKKFEYRRCRMKVRPGSACYLYESKNRKSIVASFIAGQVYCDEQVEVEMLEHDHDARRLVKQYLLGAAHPFAIEITLYENLQPPVQLQSIGLAGPPQSYCYLSENQHERLRNF